MKSRGKLKKARTEVRSAHDAVSAARARSSTAKQTGDPVDAARARRAWAKANRAVRRAARSVR